MIASGTLNHWPLPTSAGKSKKVDLPLYLTVALEGADEELVFDIAADESHATLRQLNWPTVLDARHIDFTVLSNGRGALLTHDWPKPYFPIRSTNADGSIKASDTSQADPAPN